jgi:hypothetical protein
MKYLPKFTLVAAFLGGVGLGWSVQGLSTAQAGEFHLRDFRVEGVGAFGEGNSYSAMLSYLPRYALFDQFDIKGNIGASLYKGVNQLTPVFNTGLLLGYQPLSPLLVEVGGGLQTWVGESSAPLVNANVAWVPAEPLLGRVQKIVAGYSRAFFEAPINEVRVGIELNLSTLISGRSGVTPGAPASSAEKPESVK